MLTVSTAYLPSASSSSLETDLDLAPPHPPFLANLPVTGDSGLRTLSTEVQASSLLPPHVDSASASLSDADLSHLRRAAQTSAASPHLMPPLSPVDTDPNLEHDGAATLAESLARLSSLSLPELTDSRPIPLHRSVRRRPTPPAPTSTGNDRPSPVLPPFTLPDASLSSSVHGSTPTV
ncbi:hypothetical protein MVEN_01981500 [Mycena venus]|uniref:Uncharacterized protein n=1 Tax=Mycena venus TaxID=2733690 RepID=A0A8H6XDF3_9AGAR|nr:hypothetical protein MVEN_01981500 [Mycena venus]